MTSYKLITFVGIHKKFMKVDFLLSPKPNTSGLGALKLQSLATFAFLPMFLIDTFSLCMVMCLVVLVLGPSFGTM